MQYLICITMVLLVSAGCFYSTDFIGYKTVAVILLMTVSFTAMLFEILPVLTSAVLSAIIWNFFFIPPTFTLHIDNTEDSLIFLLYFSIALIHTVLTFKIRKAEKLARDKEEKEKTIKLYNTLLNSLSHELRTPIATILGSVDTLIDNREKLSTAHQTELLTQMNKAGLRLNRQVENLLNMSRLESGMLKPKTDWCDLNELINAEIQKINTDEHHKIVFDTNDSLPLFKLDSGLIEQIIHNLLHNAVLYTPHHTTITVEAFHLFNNCIIKVADNGQGFPKNQIPLAFDKFYRLPNTKAGGSGLGLSIVKGFVEAQGGQIKLTNNPTGGAIFTIEIPAETSYLNNLKNE